MLDGRLAHGRIEHREYHILAIALWMHRRLPVAAASPRVGRHRPDE